MKIGEQREKVLQTKNIIGKAPKLGTHTRDRKIHLWGRLTRHWEEYEGHIEFFFYGGVGVRVVCGLWLFVF